MAAYCSHCDKNFYSKQTVQRHMDNFHPYEEMSILDSPLEDENDASDTQSEPEQNLESKLVAIIKEAIEKKRKIDLDAWEKCQMLILSAYVNDDDDDDDDE